MCAIYLKCIHEFPDTLLIMRRDLGNFNFEGNNSMQNFNLRTTYAIYHKMRQWSVKVSFYIFKNLNILLATSWEQFHRAQGALRVSSKLKCGL